MGSLVLLAVVAVLLWKNQEAVEARERAEAAEAKNRESAEALMKATARLSASLGQHSGAGAEAIEAALSTLILARQLHVPEPPDAFLGITSR